MNFNGYTLPKKFFSSDNALSYDLVVKYTTFGKDSSWKRHIMKNVKGEHIRILDLACGTGICSTFIPSSNLEMFGADMTYDYIIKAKNRMRYSFLTNCVAEFMPFQSDTFDVVLSSYLAKYANIPLLVDELWRIIKKNGSIIFHDFTYPTNFFMQTMWKSYFVILNLIG
ncbi:MAG TPA: class I SAM-dependent methyltransferase, partial [Nitrososphaeraceae archaeon]|nr:class I SAM-dependent methyltransferase [Nitrososphaeraceae archaeon]